MLPTLMRALLWLGIAIAILGCGGKREDPAARWAALSRCLLGEPLADGETPRERLRRIELGAPDDDWPARCAPHARKLDASLADAVGGGAIPYDRIDALWKDAPAALPAASSAVPAAPPPGAALTRRMLPAAGAFRTADVAQSGDEVRIVVGKSIWRVTGGRVESTPHGFDPAAIRLVPAPAGAPIRLMVGDRVVTPDGAEVARRGELWNTLGGSSWAVADAAGEVTTLEGSAEAGYTVVRWPETRTALPKGARWAKLGRDVVAWVEDGVLMMRRSGGAAAKVAEVAEPSRLMSCGAALYEPGARVFFPEGVAAVEAPAAVEADCADGAATFGWRADDGIHRVRCTVDGCTADVAPLPAGLPADAAVSVGPEHLVWKDDAGDLRVRTGDAERVAVDGSLETGIRFDEVAVHGDLAVLWDGEKTYLVALDPIAPIAQ